MHRRMAAVLSLVVLVTACSDDPIGITGDPLTAAEAQAMAAFLAEQGVAGTDEGMNSAQSGITVQGVPVTINVEHNSSHPCPAGGQVGLNFDLTLVMDEETQSFSYDAEGSLAHAACAFVHEAVTFTVNSGLEYQAHAAAANGVPQGEWFTILRGGFNWSATDARQGTCPIDIEMHANFDAGTQTIEGEVCGHTIDQTITWTQG